MNDIVVIGKFGRPHGVRGEVRFFLYNPNSEIVEPGLVLQVSDCEEYSEVTLASVRFSNRFDIVRLEECNSREDVVLLTNCEASVPRELLPEPDDDEFYLVDAIGLEVWGRESEADELHVLGKVKGWLEGTGHEVMSVTGPDIKGRLLVPYTDHAVEKVDIEGGRITLAPFDQWAPED